MIRDWTIVEWLSVFTIFLFSIIGSILQLFYIILLIKNRNNKLFDKHLKVRGKGLFITQFIINTYWASIHPIVIGLFIFLCRDNIIMLISLYSYGIILLDSLLTIYCIRCWILFFNFNYYALQFEKLWKEKLLSTHFTLSWFERNKRFGNVSFLLIIGFLITFILCSITIPYAFYSQLTHNWYLIAAAEIFIINLICIYLVIKLHLRHSIDNFGMRRELTSFALITIFSSTVGGLCFFITNNTWIRVWCASIPIFFSCLTVNLYQFRFFYKLSIKEQHLNDDPDDEKQHKWLEHMKLIDLLQDPTGLNEFARFLISEFSLEHLLFLIEVSQFRLHFNSKIESLKDARSTSKSLTTSMNTSFNDCDIVYKTSSVRIRNESRSNTLNINTNLATSDDEKDKDNYKEQKHVTFNLNSINSINSTSNLSKKAKNRRNMKFNLAANVPLCATIIDNQNSPIKQADIICNKFIKSKSDFEINISGSKRKQLLSTDFNQLYSSYNNDGIIQLKHIFDSVYIDIYTLLQLDSFPRFISSSPSAVKLLKKIAKRKRRTRSRARSKDTIMRKLKKHKSAPNVTVVTTTATATAIPNTTATATSKPGIKLIKSTSFDKQLQLNKQKSYSFSEDNKSDNDLSTIDKVVYSEKRLSDPFNKIYLQDMDTLNQTVIEKNIHGILHKAALKTSSLKCCGC